MNEVRQSVEGERWHRFEINGETAKVFVSRSNGVTYTVLLDVEDLPKIQDRRWTINPRTTTNYAEAFALVDGKRTKVRMHRVILGVESDEIVDHINRNGLDNRRTNLRITDLTGNGYNSSSRRGSSSRFKGVTWHKRDQRWSARIKANGRLMNLGMFDTEEDAAKAYDVAARLIAGEYARLNFPRKGERGIGA